MCKVFKTAIICCLLSLMSISYADDASKYQKQPKKAFDVVKKCFAGSLGNTEKEIKECDAAFEGFDAFTKEHEENKHAEFAKYEQKDMDKFWQKQKCEQILSAGEPEKYKAFIIYNECKMAQKYKTRLDNAKAWPAYEDEYKKSSQSFTSLSLEELEAKRKNDNFCSESRYSYRKESLADAKDKFLDGRWKLDAQCFAFESVKVAKEDAKNSARLQRYDEIYNQELSHSGASNLDELMLRAKDLDNNRISCNLSRNYLGGESFNFDRMDDKKLEIEATCHALADIFNKNVEAFKKPLLEVVSRDDEASTNAMIEYVANYVKKCPSNSYQLCSTYENIYRELANTAIEIKSEKLTKSEAQEIYDKYSCNAVTLKREAAEKYWICNIYRRLK